jgi:transposase-like protein
MIDAPIAGPGEHNLPGLSAEQVIFAMSSGDMGDVCRWRPSMTMLQACNRVRNGNGAFGAPNAAAFDESRANGRRREGAGKETVMDADLFNPIFTDENKAREWLEARVWANGRACPHCGVFDQSTLMHGKSHRPGLYQCNACHEPFTVTVGTLYERSKIPLNKWLAATHLIMASKKGMSALQIGRMLGLSKKTAWFLCHRIRESLQETGPIGGPSSVVESDETVFGGKAKNRAYAKKEPRKHTVLTLVDRDGQSRSFHIANVKAKTLRETIVRIVSRKSYLMTDELASYESIGKEFSGHGTVNHSANEFARLGSFIHINTAECRFSLMKRAVFGTHHSISEAHLHRYLTEWDYKFNTRKTNDAERMSQSIPGIVGKRLTYRRIGETANA